MIDILTIDPTDRRAVNDLVDVLQAHCSPAECETFLLDLYRWDQSIPREARVVMQCYTRMINRGGFVPSIVRKYVAVTTALSQTPEWRVVLQWRTFIASLPVASKRAA